jgi:putative ABC transport system permease protein
VQEDIAGLGSNVFIVFPTETDRGAPRPFDEDDIRAVELQIPGVVAVAGSVDATAVAVHNGQDWDTSVQGADSAFFAAQSIEVVEGRGFSPAEEAIGRDVCVIGPKVVEEIFPAGEVLGEEMRVGPVSCTVIGVIDERANAVGGGDDPDNVVLMPLKIVQRRFTGGTNVFFFVIKYDDDYAPLSIQSQLVDLLRERRVLQDGQDNDFNIVDTGEINDTVNQVTGVMTLVVTAIAGISLLVGGIGIMNIMLVSVTERTREIGIRLAIGALAREVRLQFLTEAVVLCCFGGLVGIVLALGLSTLLAGAIDIPYLFDPAVNILSFVFSAVMGIIFGYYPAHRASQLDPIDALRHE